MSDSNGNGWIVLRGCRGNNLQAIDVAMQSHVAEERSLPELEKRIVERMWYPTYPRLVNEI